MKLAFEKYLIESGFEQIGNKSDFNVLFNPFHVFEKGEERLTIECRSVIIGGKNKMEFLFSVWYKGLWFPVPAEEKDFENIFTLKAKQCIDIFKETFN